MKNSQIVLLAFFFCFFNLGFAKSKKQNKKEIIKQEKSIFDDEFVQKPQKENMVLRWSAVPFIKHYILEVTDNRGRTIIRKTTKENSYRVNFSEEGKYRYRLSLVNRMGRTELVTPWQTFEYVKVYIPNISSLEPYEMYPRTPYEIDVLGKNFNQRNQLVALQIFKEKEKIREGGQTKVIITERIGKPIALKHKVKANDSLKIDLPSHLLGTGNYKLAFLFRNRPLYVSKKALFSIEPKKFISYLYLMPSIFYVYPNPKVSVQNFALGLGYGMDIRWGTRVLKEKLELGVASGIYLLNPTPNGKKYISVAAMFPMAFYFGYNLAVPAKNVKINFLLPYVDIGYDLYFYSFQKQYAKVLQKNVMGIAKMNLGVLFILEKNKLFFSAGTAAQIGFAKKFTFSGFLFNIGMGLRLEYIPKKKE